jgi:iron complex outermembrane receptor protein
MSLEQLSQAEIKVTSVGKKEQDLWLTPAAAYVITKQDIARSAASSIPELLRSVPGLQVAQINASYWAVTARGFNSEYASKLLVLVDGRTMYSEIYSGAHWDSIDLPLEDIERIEVIRGPGAAVWGTNAANGVINIISKPASETLGTLTSGSVSRIDDVATIRYSWAGVLPGLCQVC